MLSYTNIAVLGGTGMLGRALVEYLKNQNIKTLSVARKNADINIDITDNKALKDFVYDYNPDLIINTCAYVSHEFCDNNPLEAYNLNSRPSAFLSEWANVLGFKYVYISTDGYFFGDKNLKHTENAPIRLLNEYARTKYIGEMYSLTNKNSLVVRTNIVGFRYDKTSPSFVEWVICNLKNKKEMTLFDDYYISSISVRQFTVALFKILEYDPKGLLNLASSEVFSKKQFIECLSEKLNCPLYSKTGSIKDIQGSIRPDSLGLDVSKAQKLLNYELPNLKEVIEEIVKEYNHVQ